MPIGYRVSCLRRSERFDDRGELVGVGAGLRDEGGGAVVAQLVDRLTDVGEGAVCETFLRLAEVDPRIPAAAQFFDGADVDHPVMQVGVEFGHVAGDEAAVGGDRIAGQGTAPVVVYLRR